MSALRGRWRPVPTSPVDVFESTVAAVPGTPLTVRYPSAWGVATPARRRKHGGEVFAVADQHGADSLVVMTFVDERATWYEDVDEFAEIAFGVVPGKPVRVSEGLVGTLPMFRMVERYDVGRRQVLFGYQEVLVAMGELTVAFNVMVDSDEEHVLRSVLGGIGHVLTA